MLQFTQKFRLDCINLFNKFKILRQYSESSDLVKLNLNKIHLNFAKRKIYYTVALFS